ncbi:MAG: hypothetical protein KAT77_04065 [Nanoarchaeota archaeon]|nr:hypothetical protein [Nanoarchaeota archaeon]
MKKAIYTDKAPEPGHYNQAVVVNGVLYTSGICGEYLPKHGASGSIGPFLEAQTTLCLNYIKSIVEEAGGTLVDLVRVDADIVDMTEDRFKIFDETYAKFFEKAGVPKEDLPARFPRNASLPWKGYEIMMAVVADVSGKE